jgi:3',5'-cyclic AMP phosphodiesterase CpdA
MTLRALILVALAFAARADEPFFFIQGSDPQFGMASSNRDFAQETANFEFFIATANRLKPAFVVITGDLINKDGDPAQIAEYQRIAAKLDSSIPLYSVSGNHDVGNEPDTASLAAYRKKFGRDWYSFRKGSTAFLVLNSGLIHSPQRAPAEADRQESWLRSELDKVRREGARRLIVLQHHPWFLLLPSEPDQYFNIPGVRRERYLKLFKDAGVSHVFAGHYHMSLLARDGPVEMVTTGPIGMPRAGERSGFRVVVVRDGGVEHTYYDLGAIPNRIEVK